MALSLLFKKNTKYAQSQFQNQENNVPLITFDTMVTEEHKYSSRVTYYPVERGTIVSDHIFKQPDVVILSGLVSDTPLNIFAPSIRSIAAFNALVRIFEERLIIKVITGIKIYDNMAITSLDVPRSMKTGQTLTFNIQLQKIIFDDSLTVLNSAGNIFSGVEDNTPRSIVAENTNIPLIQTDPAFSLKDQASSATNVGVQSLNTVPQSVLPNVISNLLLISGAV